MSRRRTIVAAAALLASLEAAWAGAATLPSGFQETIAFSGLTRPTAVRFSPDGRIFVAEKSGLIKVFDSLSSPAPKIFADLRTEVDDYWDRGLLGLALHPNFPATPYVYVLYSYDAPIGGTAPTWNDNCPNPPGATTAGCVISGRLSRLKADTDAMTGTEEVLLEAWGQQFPSHSIGDLHFGPDGALYASGGDGASFDNVDYGQYGIPPNPLGDPPAGAGGAEAPPSAEGGALRSQSLRRAEGGPALTNGAILRMDDAGNPLPDNPLVGSADPIARRIVAHGFRNPFRFTIQPGTGSVWIGDVGWGGWEEVDQIPNPTDAPVKNFGWPCYEGPNKQTGYLNANLDICNGLYTTPGSTAPPFFAYAHSSVVVAGESCPKGTSSITGLAFYANGSYPPAYQKALFFGDYSRQCIWVLFPDASGQPDKNNRATFIAGAATPVDLQIGPGGDLFYVDHGGGTIRRIQYFAPTATATASPTSGPAPLSVQFDGSGSQPARPGDTISLAWDLNADGLFDDSTSVSPTYLYSQPGTYAARLRVTDNHGVSTTSAPITITVGGVPPSLTIDSPAPTLTWKVGDTIAFSGSATDPQDGPLPASALSWTLNLYHCPADCHIHTVQNFEGVSSGFFAAPDHDYPSYLELKLVATNSKGVSNSKSILLNPQTVSLTFQSSPAGLPLSVGADVGITPFLQTAIVGSTLLVDAPSPQSQGGISYGFASWSDGGAAIHNVVAGASPATYSATYTSADLSISASGDSAACVGGAFSDVLTVHNSGPTQAISVSVSATISGGAALLGATGDGWTCSGFPTVVCTRAGLGLGDAPAITLAMTPPSSPGSVSLSASAASATTDPNGANNAAAFSTSIAVCAPEVTAIAPASGPASGSTTLDVSGKNFQPGLAVEIGGVPALGVSVTSPTSAAAMAPPLPPGTLNDVLARNPDGGSGTLARGYLSDFSDVPETHPFHRAVEKIFRAGITAGCAGGAYCPDAAVTRAQMAIFLLRGIHGRSYAPPPAIGIFSDVAPGAFAAAWIEELFHEGISGGCGGGEYCPKMAVDRASLAVLLLRAVHGSSYTPPPATGLFADVPVSNPFASWIEELSREGITSGCGADDYCPGLPNTRGEMAVFLSRAFGLP